MQNINEQSPSVGFKRALAHILQDSTFADQVSKNPQSALGSYGLYPHEFQALSNFNPQVLQQMKISVTNTQQVGSNLMRPKVSEITLGIKFK